MRASVFLGAGWENDSLEVLWRHAGRAFCTLWRDDAEDNRYVFIAIAVLTILALGNQPAKPQAKNSLGGFAFVDKSGNTRKPSDYHDLHQTLGTYFVLDPKRGSRCA
jgi:hypothetical protein